MNRNHWLMAEMRACVVTLAIMGMLALAAWQMLGLTSWSNWR
ncbi:hypothetical protein [Candidatus Binatus sp.]